jgi:hypothetical protein
MQVPVIAPKERITVDEYYRLRHKLLSLRRQYAYAVYGDERTNMATDKIKRLERRIEALERRLAYADIDFPFETLTLHELGTELWERLSNINFRQYADSAKRLFKPRKALEA